MRTGKRNPTNSAGFGKVYTLCTYMNSVCLSSSFFFFLLKHVKKNVSLFLSREREEEEEEEGKGRKVVVQHN